jgi:CRP-like cAMP-binding protein
MESWRRDASLEDAINAQSVLAAHLESARNNVARYRQNGQNNNGANPSGVRLMKFARHGVIGEDMVNQDSVNMFLICSGTMGLKSILQDGRSQILQFCFPGDILVPSFSRNLPEVSAYAVCDTTVLHARHPAPDVIADRLKGVGMAFLQLMCLLHEREAIQNIVLGHLKNEERLASFLLEVALWTGRLSRSGSTELELPMTREEIGDYLGLNAATVTRGLTSLRGKGVVEIVSPKKITIRDLGEICRITPVAGALLDVFCALSDVYGPPGSGGLSRCLLSDAAGPPDFAA